LPAREALGAGNHVTGPALLAGDAFAFASATCFAISNVTIARGARPEAEDNGAFVSLLITTLISGLGWLAVGLARGFEPVTPRALLWFAGAGVFTAFVGRVFFYASVERLGAMRSSTLKRLNPFFAVVLGVLVLREELTGGMTIGLALLAASFAVLMTGARAVRAEAKPGASALARFGYFYGIVSALGYSSGYLLRKMGLAEAHDALLGAMVGCFVGALLFVATAAFNADYARAVRATFARPNYWLMGAGTMSSFGQILYFAALNESPMSRVALISSMEVFVTLFLGFVFLRSHERLTPALVVAALLGVAGTAFIVGF
jgi:drug/metabolite transporter (DMT)-like permease